MMEALRNLDGSEDCWASPASIAEFFCVPVDLVAAVVPPGPLGAQRYLRKWLWTVLVAGSRSPAQLAAIEDRLDQLAAKAKTRLRLAQRAQRFRRAITERDGPGCAYCGRLPKGKRRLTLDHVVPVSHGGDSILANLVQACPDCNIDKHDLHLADWAKDSLALARFMRSGPRQLDAFARVRHVLAVGRRVMPHAGPWEELEAELPRSETLPREDRR